MTDHKQPNKSPNLKRQTGFIMATLVIFTPALLTFGAIVILLSVSSYRNAILQHQVKQAQLASLSAMERAKEEFELDIDYAGTAETTLTTDSQYTVTYEVEHIGFTNDVHTQQDVKGIGRVYYTGTTTVLAEKAIFGKITRQTGDNSSVRFIFIIDNSGSMTSAEFSDAQSTINVAVQYVVENVPSASVAVVNHGTNTTSKEHRYDVTVPFTTDLATAIGWDRQFGSGTSGSAFNGSHLAATLAVMRYDDVYAPGAELDLVGASSVQYIVFTDAEGYDVSTCCQAIKKVSTEPSNWHTGNGSPFVVLDEYGEFNALKDGSVFEDDGYPGLTAQFTMLNVNTTTAWKTRETSAAVASPGGSWYGVIDANPGDPEGEGVLPRRYINTSLAVTDPNDIIDIINEIIETEINY